MEGCLEATGIIRGMVHRGFSPPTSQLRASGRRPRAAGRQPRRTAIPAAARRWRSSAVFFIRSVEEHGEAVGACPVLPRRIQGHRAFSRRSSSGIARRTTSAKRSEEKRRKIVDQCSWNLPSGAKVRPVTEGDLTLRTTVPGRRTAARPRVLLSSCCSSSASSTVVPLFLVLHRSRQIGRRSSGEVQQRPGQPGRALGRGARRRLTAGWSRASSWRSSQGLPADHPGLPVPSL